MKSFLLKTSLKSNTSKVRGFGLVEVVAGLVCLLPLLLAFFDLGMIVLSVQINDSACREAARAAACGNPNDARARAVQVINLANQRSGAYVSNLRLDSVTSTVSAAEVAALSPYGGPVQGSVTVRTFIDVHPYIIYWVYTGKPTLTFTSQQTFPYSYVVPNTAQ